MTPEIEDVILKYAAQYNLPAGLVRAICEQESSFNPWSVRYEPTYRWLVGDKLNMSLTERHTQMCSWGLMQVMGGTARELGLTGYLSQLCDPETGVQYGCRYLRRLFERYQIWDDAIAAYNAGSPRRVGPTYVNQGYVDKVNGYWQQADGQKNKV